MALKWRAKGVKLKPRCPLNNKLMRLGWHAKGYLLATKEHHNKTSNTIKKHENFLQNTHFLPPILESETAKKQEFRPNFAV